MSVREQASLIREVCVFCLEHKGRCFKDWSGEKIFKYISFHWLNGTLFVARDNDKGYILGVGIAWRVKKDLLVKRENEGLPQFDWSKLDDEGDATLVCDVFGTKKICHQLFDMAMQKWPEARKQPLFTYRNGDLTSLPMARFLT